MAFAIHRLFYPGARQGMWAAWGAFIRTGGARSFGHQENFTLLLAGSLFQVAFVLVRVPVGATDGHVIVVTLRGRDREQRCQSHVGWHNILLGTPPPVLKPWVRDTLTLLLIFTDTREDFCKDKRLRSINQS